MSREVPNAVVQRCRSRRMEERKKRWLFVRQICRSKCPQVGAIARFPGRNLRARSSALQVQGLSSRTAVIKRASTTNILYSPPPIAVAGGSLSPHRTFERTWRSTARETIAVSRGEQQRRAWRVIARISKIRTPDPRTRTRRCPRRLTASATPARGASSPGPSVRLAGSTDRSSSSRESLSRSPGTSAPETRPGFRSAAQLATTTRTTTEASRARSSPSTRRHPSG